MRSGGGAPTDTPAAAIDGRCASGVAGGVFFCFSSATRWRCLVITRRRLRSFSRRSCRRSRARVQLCQSWRRRSRQAASTFAQRRLHPQGRAAGDRRAEHHQRAREVEPRLQELREQHAEGARRRRSSRRSRRCGRSRSGAGPAPRRAAGRRRSRAPRPCGAPRRRSRRQPATSRKKGISRQVRPKKPNATAETWAPTAPIQLWAWASSGTACAAGSGPGGDGSRG